jgi:hypothetical protein
MARRFIDGAEDYPWKKKKSGQLETRPEVIGPEKTIHSVTSATGQDVLLALSKAP